MTIRVVLVDDHAIVRTGLKAVLGAARDIECLSPGVAQRGEWRDDGVYLTGWAEVVFDGTWMSSAQ